MRSRMTWRTFFDAVIMAKVKRRLLLPPEAPPVLPRFAGRPLGVRGPFEERITGASSSRRERGLPRCPWMGCELG
jgi:hypothetical protein